MSAADQEVTLPGKRKLWLEVLSGKDKHSVVHQITAMTWNAAAYQVVKEARRLAPADPEGGVQLNGMLHRLIDHGFFNTHTWRRSADSWTLLIHWRAKKGSTRWRAFWMT